MDGAALFDGLFAGYITEQASNYSAAPSGGSLTYASLCEALDRVYNAPVVFHGSDQDPHLYSPNSRSFFHRFCVACGMPRDEETAQAAIETLRAELAREGINT
jgi:hypothetical protein